jgi:thioredoxin-dependent peroxiredoxin
MMRRFRIEPLLTAIAVSMAIVSPALADMSATATPSPAATAAGPGVGAVAPKVALQSVFGGKAESFDLQAAAAQRPIVLYFFPKAFTAG